MLVWTQTENFVIYKSLILKLYMYIGNRVNNLETLNVMQLFFIAETNGET